MIPWSIKGESYGSCNCDHSCPCQFESLPTHGSCMGFEAFEVQEGHFGDVDLAGVKAIVVYSWPGPIFEGGGTTQAIIDEGASEAQRDAISRIVKGEETKEAANHWWVFHAMSDQVLEDRIAPIEFVMDQDARTARVSVPGVLEAVGEPIKSPVDDAPHRVQIRCPEGIEFEVADVGNGRTEIVDGVPMHLEDTYGQWNALDHDNHGPAHVR